MKYIFFLLLLFSSLYSEAQVMHPDSIFKKVEEKFSTLEALKIRQEYEDADPQQKAIMLNILSMPMSSRKELIENFNKNEAEIWELKETFENLIPQNKVVFLELKPSTSFPGMIEGIDFLIYEKQDSSQLELVDGDWDLKYGSDRLDSLLTFVQWDRMTLLAIKNLLQTANCISIQNNDLTEIGFTRSGLGKYFYVLAPNKLTEEEKIKYNDGCRYIIHSKHLILEYMGGMAGPQCFTD